MAAGPGIREAEIDAQVVDIAPTLLGLMGAPLIEDMDGRLLQEILTTDVDPDIVSSNIPQEQASTNDGVVGGDAVSNLEDLGYL
jgi:arylsulfatase A-like enzyme